MSEHCWETSVKYGHCLQEQRLFKLELLIALNTDIDIKHIRLELIPHPLHSKTTAKTKEMPNHILYIQWLK